MENKEKGGAQKDEVQLNEKIQSSMGIGKVFKDFRNIVTSLDFSEDGTQLLCADDTTQIIYDTINAKKIKTLCNKVHGIANAKFTHTNEAIICTTTATPYQVFYWSIHENEVIKTFDSSESEFIDINLNPNDDTFLAINSAGILQVWDLSAVDMEPLAIFNIREDQKLDDKFNINLAANFDTTGVVLAIAIFIEETSDVENKVASTSNRIDLFDVEKFEEGRFGSWKLDSYGRITSLKFSNNGYYILTSTVKGEQLILDAFEGSLIRKFTIGSTGRLESSFTPDSKFVISGADLGSIFVFDIENNKEIARLEGHVKPCSQCKFSPTCIMIASACQNILLWLPKNWD